MTIPSLNIPIKPLFVCGHKCNHYNRGSTIWGIWGNEEGAGIIRDETWAAWTGWQNTSSKDQLSTDQLRVDLVRVDLDLVRVDLTTPSHCTVVKFPPRQTPHLFLVRLSLVFVLLVVSLNGSVEGHFQLTLVEVLRQCTHCTHTPC